MSRPPLWPAWLLSVVAGLAALLYVWLTFADIRRAMQGPGAYNDAPFYGSIALALTLLTGALVSGARRARSPEPATAATGWLFIRVAGRLVAVVLTLFGLFAGGCGLMFTINPDSYTQFPIPLILGIIPGLVALGLAWLLWRYTRPRPAP